MNKQLKENKVEEFVSELIVQMKAVILDPAMEKRPDLKEILIRDIQILEKMDDLDKLAPQLFQQISTKYIENPKDFPKSLVELYYWARVETNKYDSLVWGSVQAGNDWFEK